MDTGTQITLLLSVVTVAIAFYVVAMPRPGRFMLARVLDAERHRAATRRVLAVNVLAAVSAAAVIVRSHDATAWTPAIAGIAAMVVPGVWILFELRLALSGTPPAAVPSRFRVSLEPTRGFVSYLSPSLALLNAAAVILPPAVLLALGNDGGPWFFFLPLMLFLTALVLFCAWMQARERWVLPADGGERYVELQHERRTRMVRLLETGLACWNLAFGMIWICVALDGSGPGDLGGIVAVGLAGPGFVIAMATRLPRLTRVADELSALAKTEVLGTRHDGWRCGGLVYYAPSDAALFVPRRSGLGQTLNLARPAAWLFLTAVLLVPPIITVLALAGTRG